MSSESFINLQNMYIRRHTWGLGEHQSKEDEQIGVSGVKMNFFKLLMTTDYLIIKKLETKKLSQDCCSPLNLIQKIKGGPVKF